MYMYVCISIYIYIYIYIYRYASLHEGAHMAWCRKMPCATCIVSAGILTSFAREMTSFAREMTSFAREGRQAACLV